MEKPEINLNEIPDDQLEAVVYRLFNGINHNPIDEEMVLNSNKLIICKHEIVIRVEASVMEEDDNGELLGTKEICKNTYRIPVPSDKDYHVFMKAFFDHLQQSMAQSYDKANKST